MNDYGVPGEPRFFEMMSELARNLVSLNLKLATAESCTGGWIAKCCTDLAGSSAWFEQGYVTYSNAAKQQMLGVSANTLLTDGAVSEAVAKQMAEGARRSAGVTVALSVTGIAGPDGGSVDKPVGTVWFGWALGQEPARAEMMRFEGSRDTVRRQAVAHSLTRLLNLLNQ